MLDDPLSAVDPAVADGIFNDCIVNGLRNKCVILVTHQLQFLKQCKRILVLNNGTQQMMGSYDEIIAQGFDVDEILTQYNKTLQDETSNK